MGGMASVRRQEAGGGPSFGGGLAEIAASVAAGGAKLRFGRLDIRIVRDLARRVVHVVSRALQIGRCLGVVVARTGGDKAESDDEGERSRVMEHRLSPEPGRAGRNGRRRARFRHRACMAAAPG